MWKFESQFRKDNPQTIGETDNLFDLDNYKDWLELQIERPVIKLDKNNNPIRKGDRFRFKFLKELHNPIELIGSFDWCQSELRYEIDIWENEEYTCLSYIGNGIMSDFELY